MLRSEGFQKYLRNTSWMFAERVVRLAVVLFTGAIVARYLGAELFGQLNYATAFVGLFFALSAMGLDEIVVRDLVRRPGRRDVLLGSAAVVKFGGALVLLALVSLATLVKDMAPLTATLVMITALAELMKPFTVIEYYYQSRVQARKGTQVMMVQVFISAGLKLAVIWAYATGRWDAVLTLKCLAWVYVVEQLSGSVGYLVSYAREGGSWRDWTVTRRMCAYVLKQSWPLVIYGVALFIQARIDAVMLFDMLKSRIGEVAANAEVGQYSAALKMIEALGFLPVIVQKSLAPAVTRARMESQEKYEVRLLNLYRFMFLLFIATAVPVFLLAEPIMVLLYGDEFRPAGVLLGLFAIRLFFTNLGVGKTSFITNENLFRYALFTAIVGAGLNILINLWLIPEYRSIGAIWATIGSNVVSLFLLDLLFRGTRRNFGLMMRGITTFWKIDRVM